MQERSRALNRHHKERMKVRATKYLHDRNSSLEGFLGGLGRHIGRSACTPASCSCHMCGNPRKYMGDLTIAEQSDKEFVQIEDDNEKPRNWIHTEPDRWESAEHELILR